MDAHHIIIQFDGGCVPNPGQKYGSYSISFDDIFMISKNRFNLGCGTCNEAEFEALIEALHELRRCSRKAQVDLKSIDILVLTDSTIVRNRLQDWQKNEKPSHGTRMSELGMQAVLLLRFFGSFEVKWHSRENNVAVFGH
jgi:ribonuclease HI